MKWVFIIGGKWYGVGVFRVYSILFFFIIFIDYCFLINYVINILPFSIASSQSHKLKRISQFWWSAPGGRCQERQTQTQSFKLLLLYCCWILVETIIISCEVKRRQTQTTRHVSHTR